MQKGDHKGSVAVIVEIIDHNRALVDCPSTGVPRQVVSYKNMNLTDFVVEKLPRGAGSKTVQKKFDAQGLLQKWQETSEAKMAAKQQIRANLGDFDRFKVMFLQKKRTRIIKA